MAGKMPQTKFLISLLNETYYHIFPDTIIYIAILDIYVGGSPNYYFKLKNKHHEF